MSNGWKASKAQRAARAKFPRLYAWVRAALRSGVVSYRLDTGRSGMRATVLLWTIRMDGSPKRTPYLDVAWPDDGAAVAGFSVKRRSFVVNGCGFDRAQHALDGVFHLFGVEVRGVRMERLHYPE